jgi:YidC/Oxa1 family membrane protein insertase
LDNQRNLIIAVALSLALVLGFDVAMGWLYPPPPADQVAAAAAKADAIVARISFLLREP